MYLLDAFPIEAGEINSDERVLPKLSGLSLVMSLVLLLSQTSIALIMLTHYDPRLTCYINTMTFERMDCTIHDFFYIALKLKFISLCKIGFFLPQFSSV